MTTWIDGVSGPGSAVPKLPAGRVAPFETMGAEGGTVALWDRHLARLQASAARLGLPFAPGPALRAAATDLLLQNGHGDCVLRLLLLPHAAGVHTILTTRARGPAGVLRLLPTVVERPATAPPGDLKAEPRAFYDAVRQQAQDGGADDGIVVGSDGALRETAISNLWLRVDGVWVTPALDGAVLPGIARALLLERAAAAGLRTQERRCDFADLHRAQAIATSNAVHGPRAAALGDAGPVGVQFVHNELCALWRAATRD